MRARTTHATIGPVGRNAFLTSRGRRLVATNRATTSVAERYLVAMLAVPTKGRLAGTTMVGCFPSESPWVGITDDDLKVALVRTAQIDSQVTSLEEIGIDHWLLVFGH